ncbi:hypothetical protein [Clostridium sp. UBA2485]|uniref:hypothetical protein n=1 Tax=Clostridium sp. UBA2485 TaxID=1946352 RepID=UPI0025BCB48D|nr:hypothetical protein [Clostridium sp. UBA2485]
MLNLDYDQQALLYAEKYGIVDYIIKNDKMIYYENFRMEHTTYKCEVCLTTFKEKRTELKRYYSKYN